MTDESPIHTVHKRVCHTFLRHWKAHNNAYPKLIKMTPEELRQFNIVNAFAKPDEMMRLSGALGPLQGEALTGTLTILIKPTATGSVIRFDYVVGGYMRFKVADVAPGVDKVLGEQLVGLANALGGALPVAHDERDGEAKDASAKSEPGLDAVAADLADEAPKDAPESD